MVGDGRRDGGLALVIPGPSPTVSGSRQGAPSEISRKSPALQERGGGRGRCRLTGTHSRGCLSLGPRGYQGDFDSAAYHFNQALEINIIALGESHPNTASSYGNAALMYSVNKNYDKALEYNMKALTIMKKLLGENHPRTATYYSNIGASYMNLDNYEEALKYINKALFVKKAALGEEHPDLADYYNNLGEAYYRMGDKAKSIENFNTARSLWEKAFGPEDKRVIKVQGTIDSILEETEKEE